MQMGHSMIQGFECSMCGQLMNTEKEEKLEIDLFGFVQYAVCLNCWQKVDKETMTNRIYRIKWTKRFNRIKAKTLIMERKTKELKR